MKAQLNLFIEERIAKHLRKNLLVKSPSIYFMKKYRQEFMKIEELDLAIEKAEKSLAYLKELKKKTEKIPETKPIELFPSDEKFISVFGLLMMKQGKSENEIWHVYKNTGSGELSRREMFSILKNRYKLTDKDNIKPTVIDN